MNRFAPLDVTLETLSVQLYPDERILTHADGVGLYDGKDKAPRYDDGRAVLTTHRIVFISSTRPHSNSAALDLAAVKQTEYWVGFLKSHPKITLVLSEPAPIPSDAVSDAVAAARDKNRERLALAAAAGERAWVCRICGMRNVPSVELGLKCSLCGVARDPLPTSLPPSSLGTPPRSASPSSSRRPSSFSSASTRTAGSTSPAPQLFDPKETGSRIACPVCTFLNHHSMATCEVCESPLFPSNGATPRVPPNPVSNTYSTPPSRANTPGPTTDPASAIPAPSGSVFVRLSFRKGGEKTFYSTLKEALAKRAWDLAAATAASRSIQRSGTHKSRQAVGNSGSPPSETVNLGVGIDAIMRGMDLDSRDREDSLDDALKDLDSLMRKAKDMISLAQTINARLAPSSTAAATGGAQTTTAEERQAVSLASTSLQSLGLVSAAVTADLVSDSKRYHEELAKELAEVLRKGGVMERHGGIVGLDEVWCLWNRARGVALVSPKDLRLAAPYLPHYALSHATAVRLRVFPSGLTILYTPHFSLASFSARILELLDLRQATVASLSEAEVLGMAEIERREREGVNVLEVARAEQLSVGLAKEMMDLLEMGEGAERRGGGHVVRDEQGGEGTRWHRNLISGAVWDGQVFST